jgi:hypothetical protein
MRGSFVRRNICNLGVTRDPSSIHQWTRASSVHGVGLPKRIGLKNTLAIDADVERYVLLGSAKQKHPGVPRFQIYSSPSGPRLPHNELAIKIVPRAHNMILDDSAMQPGASYLALACTQHPHPDPASRLTIDADRCSRNVLC